MFLKGLLSSVCFAPDGGEGGGDPSTLAPQPQPVIQQQPVAPVQQQTSSNRNADTIADLRAEAAARRIQNKELQTQLEAAEARAVKAASDLEAAKTSAVAPLTAKLEQAQQRMITLSVKASLSAAGLIDPDLASLMASMPNAPKVTLNDEFEVVGADEAVKAFKEWKPDFFKKEEPKQEAKAPQKPPANPKQPTGAGNDPPASGQAPVTDVKKMNAQEYAAYKQSMLRDIRQSQQTGQWAR